MNWPAVTATPLLVSVPAPGSVVILTAASVLPSMSLKPKSAAVSTRAVSSSAVIVLLVPDGASLTGVTVIVVCATSLDELLSLIVTVTSRATALTVLVVLEKVIACSACS